MIKKILVDAEKFYLCDEPFICFDNYIGPDNPQNWKKQFFNILADKQKIRNETFLCHVNGKFWEVSHVFCSSQAKQNFYSFYLFFFP